MRTLILTLEETSFKTLTLMLLHLFVTWRDARADMWQFFTHLDLIHDAAFAQAFKVVQLLVGLGRGERRILTHIEV